MPFDRGAVDKSISKETPTYNVGGRVEAVNEPGKVEPRVSGGISFCPSCGAMMINRKGTLSCSQCGYQEYNRSTNRAAPKNRPSQQERKRKENEKRQKIKRQMQDVLFYMYQGKTRSQASSLSGVPLSRISNWYNEGKNGYGYDNIHFYHEVSAIERDQEIRRREEINRQNRLKEQERKRKQREEKQIREQLEENTIKKQMDLIIKLMENGQTRSQAAINVGIRIYKVNEWFDMGKRRKKEPYTSFYNKVSTIEIRNRKTSESKAISSNIKKQMDEILSLMRRGLTRSEAARKLNIRPSTVNNWYNKGSHGDSAYVKFYNDIKSIEDKRKRDASSAKPKSNYISTSSKVDNEEKMDKIISYMKNGLTRNKAAEKAGLSVITVNNWYNKGSHGDSAYVKFYNDVKSIESSRKPKSTYISQSSTSNLVKCPKCGKKYNKKLNKECPNCKKTKALTEIKYCQNCGKKITNDDLYYCSNCGASLKTGKKSKSSTNITSKKDDLSDWITCCVAVFVLFMIIAFLGVLI